MRSSSEIADLQAFAAVGTALSFSRAAERLAVSPSALSQAIRRVEARLQVRLLQRSTRSVSLTDAGAALLGRLTHLFTELDDALASVHEPAGEIAGRVRVNTSRIAAEVYLSPVLPRFLAQHPKVEVELHVDDTIADLVASGCDIGLRLGEKLAPDMVAVPLGGPDASAVVASPAYLAEHGTPDTPQALLQHRCIRFRWPGSGAIYRWEFGGADGGDFALDVPGPLVVSDTRLALQAALDGVGIAYVLYSQAAPLLAQGRLVRLLAAWCPPYPGFHLYRFGRHHLPPQVRAFIDAVVAHAATLPSAHRP